MALRRPVSSPASSTVSSIGVPPPQDCLSAGQPRLSHDAGCQRGSDRGAWPPHSCPGRAHRVRVGRSSRSVRDSGTPASVHVARESGLCAPCLRLRVRVLWFFHPPASAPSARDSRVPSRRRQRSDPTPNSATGATNSDNVVGVAARIDTRVSKCGRTKKRGANPASGCGSSVRTPRIRVPRSARRPDDVAHLPGQSRPSVGGQAPAPRSQQARDLTREGNGDEAMLFRCRAPPRNQEEPPSRHASSLRSVNSRRRPRMTRDWVHAGLGDELGDTRNPTSRARKLRSG